MINLSRAPDTMPAPPASATLDGSRVIISDGPAPTGRRRIAWRDSAPGFACTEPASRVMRDSPPLPPIAVSWQVVHAGARDRANARRWRLAAAALAVGWAASALAWLLG